MQVLSKERSGIESQLGRLERLEISLRDGLELLVLARLESDAAFLGAIQADSERSRAVLEGLERESMFPHPDDPNGCFLEISAGVGGTEACDWSQMLLRMYVRYATQRGLAVELQEETPDSEAGIRSATIHVTGTWAHGLLRTEAGAHRLIRKSPFDPSGGRQTSFATVFVYPEVEEGDAVEIKKSDVRIDTYRASGAGGQHVNKTDSAVRLTHLPTGIVVQCQDDRSQHNNREVAWKRLWSKIRDHEERKRKAAQQTFLASRVEPSWGHQIRNYVLDQGLIKDVRTGVESNAPHKVLDGGLDLFILASLRMGI